LKNIDLKGEETNQRRGRSIICCCTFQKKEQREEKRQEEKKMIHIYAAASFSHVKKQRPKNFIFHFFCMF
jgi:gluconate kinase